MICNILNVCMCVYVGLCGDLHNPDGWIGGNEGILTKFWDDSRCSAACQLFSETGGGVRVGEGSGWAVRQCLIVCCFSCCDSESAGFSHLGSAVLSLPPSVHLRLRRRAVNLEAPSDSQTRLHVARQRSSGINGPECWQNGCNFMKRERSGVSLFTNLITDLLLACVCSQRNLKATPGPPGDAKKRRHARQSSLKRIEVDYSGLSWPWGEAHTAFCSRRNEYSVLLRSRCEMCNLC